MKERIIPTMPKTMEQVPWFVMVFMATVKVNKWLAMTKMRKMTKAAPMNSLPHFPAMISAASATVVMCGYFHFICPIT